MFMKKDPRGFYYKLSKKQNIGRYKYNMLV